MEGNPSDGDNSNKQHNDDEQEESETQSAGTSGLSTEKKMKMEVGDPPAATSSETMIVDGSDKDENVDSGISLEKCESISSEDHVPSSSSNTQPPPDGGVAPGPSTHSGDLGREFRIRLRNRIYRSSRPLFGHSLDSDDDDSPMDSDDNSPGRDGVPSILELIRGLASEHAVGIIEPDVGSNQSSIRANVEGASSSESNSNHDDSGNSGSDIDTDSDQWSDMDSSTHNEDTNSDAEIPPVLLKRKPTHTWNVIEELNKRERGIGIGHGRAAKTDVLFEQRFYGSLRSVQRLELMYKLNKHRGCVNSINFHPEGKLLASGSDDCNVILWDWATNNPIQVIKSGHKTNIFQSKFLYLNCASQLNIVTCARDGQVRLLQVPPSGAGSAPYKRRLAQHSKSAHKLHVSAAEPHVIISSGEDGQVILADVRQETASKLLRVRNDGVPVALYSVSGHPLNINELCVAGHNRLVKVYDRRKAGANAHPIKSFCPDFFLRTGGNNSSRKFKYKFTSLYVTCAVYNHDGSEILASYNDDDIYLFDTTTDNGPPPNSYGFTYRYSGHRNCATYKGVSFFGPHCEFIVSGSDCGNIYIWDKKSESIVQWMMGDEKGVVNSIETHPRCPILATSGLDNDIKIWIPSNETEPSLQGLKEVVIDNSRAQLRSPLTFLPGLSGVLGNSLLARGDSDEEYRAVNVGSDFDRHACRPF